ncbi:Vacuolar protein sorting-associated protein-like protein [Emericellopsis cladophorae]|uniref:Vacuolar protein sorting-associated protein-like protein n=1 Tax=Emericellopsis cladophorae TaxID=2686198 RepID=A0A9P9Y4M4_9HYPO|nr:Vacuolar protein sorting-associated protein-like protein [Emericellopsis cladophorae]KAI6783023.1 Vacuolar protein sorting-associated protein-like protein [Emericellopsis cladophorae]
MFSSPTGAKSTGNIAALSSSPGGRSEYPFPAHAQGPLNVQEELDSFLYSLSISTLLQPPIIRTGLSGLTSSASNVHKPPTTRDIPPVTLTNIEHVESEEFAPYLSQFGALHEQLKRIKESESEASSSRKGSRHDESGEASGGDGLLRPGGRSSMTRKGSAASLSSLNSNEAPSPVRRSSSSFGRRAAQGPPPLSTIPTVYFDEDFHLENPRTFDVVSERSEVIRPSQNENDNKTSLDGDAAAPRKALATNAILQEKLSWYMDTIEVHLINSISTASTTFFTALGSLKELHSEAADSVQRIKALRLELEALDKEIVTQGLDIVKKRQRQENLRQLNGAVLQLRLIVDGVADCETLVEKGEVDKALDSIDSLEYLIAGERETSQILAEDVTLRDLRGATALQGVNADLMTLRMRVGKAYEAQFVNVLLGDLKKHMESVSSTEILLRWSHAASRARGGHARSPSNFPSYLTGTEELKRQLAPTIKGLDRAQHVAAAAIIYREIALKEIRNLIRRPLPSSSDDDNESMMSVSTAASGGRVRSSQEKSSILARNLRALGPDEAEELLATIYVGVTETLRRLTTQTKVILDIASSLSAAPNGDGLKSPPSRSPISSPRLDRNMPPFSGFQLQEELHKTLDVANLLGQAVDVAIDKIVKVLKVRNEQAGNLPLDFFLRYFTMNLYFANECEAISGRSGTALKNVVNSHIKDFVQKTRDTEMQKLAQGMESDQWNAKDFSDENAELLGQLLEASTQDPAAWSERTKIWVPYHEIEKAERESSAASTEPNGTGKDKGRTAIIDSEKFVLPSSAILCMQGTAQFLHLIAGIPSMTTDIASSLVAYLQLFNSRCTQLILGAGATRSAGLKNITSKHLALAAQALSFISTLIPHVREFVRRHAGSGAGVSSVMGEFDKVRRLLQEHQDSIHQKLVDIMSGRASVHAKGMRSIEWDKQVDGIHPYMETLCKETSTLHRVLTKHLPETSILMIMGPVFGSYKEQLGAALKAANPKTQEGHQSMIRDVEFFTTKLGKVDGFGDAGESLLSVAKTKEVKAAEPLPSPAEEEKSPEKGSSSADMDSSDPAEEEIATKDLDQGTTTVES